MRDANQAVRLNSDLLPQLKRAFRPKKPSGFHPSEMSAQKFDTREERDARYDELKRKNVRGLIKTSDVIQLRTGWKNTWCVAWKA